MTTQFIRSPHCTIPPCALMLLAALLSTAHVAAQADFSDPAVYGAGSPNSEVPYNVVAGDLTGNGYDDLVITKATPALTHGTGRINILFNIGGGTYAPPVTIYDTLHEYDPRPTGVALADITGNGALDIVARMNEEDVFEECYDEDWEWCDCWFEDCAIEKFWTERMWYVYVWHNDGSGEFTFGSSLWVTAVKDPFLWAEQTTLALADFNGNGLIDVAVPAADGGLRFLPNNGDGGFTWSGAAFLSGASSVTALDLNNNGHLDLASVLQVGVSFDNRIRTFVNDGDASFSIEGTYTTEFTPRPIAIAAGDLTGNGFADIVTANNGDALGPTAVSLFVNTGGTLNNGIDYVLDGNARSVAIDDITLNGSNEIVVSHGDVIEVLDEAGNSLAQVTSPQWSRTWSVALGDVNQSGAPDIAVTDRDNNIVSVALNETEAQPTCVGDLTGSGSVGVPDLLELLASWGACDDPGDCPADLTGSGTVGVPDLLELLANWGSCAR